MRTLLPSEHTEHPIERIMDSAFGKMRTLTDADIIVGNPIIMPDGTTVVPISKISIGIVTGGGEYSQKQQSEYPFAGASGAGMSVSPVCFLVSDGKSVRMLNVGSKSMFDKVVETVPDVVGSIFGKKK
ncbi:MAG: sporulation protein YtfJ [Clostridiales bacterium]|uniref:spore germination protein GerW family protein n=1 Tax=Anaerocaecibacter muris TaxID=2941513 RepID=UPI0020400F96|nr:spore germination protein GerW family protein [Anaerocaecibacter muris]MDE6966332.1 sporulation protein YtfJ [Clostridiales bacterium]